MTGQYHVHPTLSLRQAQQQAAFHQVMTGQYHVHPILSLRQAQQQAVSHQNADSVLGAGMRVGSLTMRCMHGFMCGTPCEHACTHMHTPQLMG